MREGHQYVWREGFSYKDFRNSVIPDLYFGSKGRRPSEEDIQMHYYRIINSDEYTFEVLDRDCQCTFKRIK